MVIPGILVSAKLIGEFPIPNRSFDVRNFVGAVVSSIRTFRFFKYSFFGFAKPPPNYPMVGIRLGSNMSFQFRMMGNPRRHSPYPPMSFLSNEKP